ncbi:MAG TPA: PBP1A family penicillin-binding protein [Longimicrobiales bacterium]
MRKFVLTVLLTAAGLLAACSSGGSVRGCPSVDDIRNYRPPEATRIFAVDGSVIADLSPQRRIVVDLEDIPPIVANGFVAVEDRRFWQHNGVDYRAIARAFWRDLTSLSLKEGSSTITMQLVRKMFDEELPMSDKIRRKYCEIRLARRIEKELSKREILELYLNQIPLSRGLYGVEATSQGLFGKPVKEVTIAEAALLIGMNKSPERFNPRRYPLRAIQRRNVVLDVLAREGVITRAQAEKAKAEPLRLAPPAETGQAPYFVAQVRKELQRRFGPDADTRGLRVYTGLDPVLQKAAHAALVAQIEKIESGAYGPYRHPKPPKTGVPVAENGTSPYLQGMVVALDPRTGEVRALVGGRDFAHSQFDRAFNARRQPGSAFKPIVYAAAIEAGMPVTSRIDATPVVRRGVGAPAWQPGDLLPDSLQTVLSLREAFARSSNYAAIRVGEWVGYERVSAMGRALGLTTPIPNYPSVYLGAAEVIPVELVAAYAAFANGGYRVRPLLFTRVEDSRGKVLWRAPIRRERAIDEGVAYLTLSLMEDVIEYGTGAGVRAAGFWPPAAGKTGTTNDGKDTWFIGMTPDLVAGVWLGFDRPKPILSRATGGRLAVPVWASFMKEVYRNRPAPGPWVPPPTLASLAIDEATGALATGNCPPDQVRIEHFLPGTEPREFCPLHPESAAERFFERLWDGFRRLF